MAKTTDSFLDKEQISINKHDYIISKIPAFQAQHIFMKMYEYIADNDIGSIPDTLIAELLSYTAAINDSKAEVVLENPTIVNMMVPSCIDLFTLETKMIEKNFDFLFDGSLSKVFEGIQSKMGKALKNSKI